MSNTLELNDFTPDELQQIRAWRADCPYRITYVARKDGVSRVSAVTTLRIPRQLVRDGWTVMVVR